MQATCDAAGDISKLPKLLGAAMYACDRILHAGDEISWALYQDKIYEWAIDDGCILFEMKNDWTEFVLNETTAWREIADGEPGGFCYTNTPISSQLGGVEATPSTVTYGQTTEVTGKLQTSWAQASEGAPIELWELPAGADLFTKVASTRTLAPGGIFFFDNLKPDKNTRYKVRFPGNSTVGLAEAVKEIPQVGVKVKVSQTTSTTKLRLGRYRSLAGSVSPSHTGTVKLTIKRNGAPFDVKNVNLNDSEYWMEFRPPRTGTYSVKASYAGDADNLGNTSPTKSFKVVR
jgi:hypothetical protein